MSDNEARDIIKNITPGTRLEIIKTNGDIIEVVLASQEVRGLEEKRYDNLVVPALPAALIVYGGRWGKFRLDTQDIVSIVQIS